jgi:hypothetical protein
MSKSGSNLLPGKKRMEPFTVGISQLQTTVNYIRNQTKHHSKSGFDTEWQAILKRHGLQPDNE